jgi:D-sedoheptulose 7-phosphate isomerase
LKVVGLLGRDGGRVRSLCDLALVVPSDDTQRIQETHNLIGHILCDLVEAELFPKTSK